MVPNWSTKELKTGPIEQSIATNNDVFFGLLPLPTTHTELPQQWRFREINASNDEYCRPSSVFDSFMMRRCYGICFRWPQGNIRWVYTPPINLEIAYDNLEFQVVVWFQVVVQQPRTLFEKCLVVRRGKRFLKVYRLRNIWRQSYCHRPHRHTASHLDSRKWSSTPSMVPSCFVHISRHYIGSASCTFM